MNFKSCYKLTFKMSQQIQLINSNQPNQSIQKNHSKQSIQKNQMFAYSWSIDDEEKERTIIRIYGLNKKNENVCLVVNDFTPYIYVELPDFINWDEGKAILVASKFDTFMKGKEAIKKSLVFKRKLYGVSFDKNGERTVFPFLFMTFNHSDDIRQLGFKLRQHIYISGLGNLLFKIHESNANPVLQMTSLRNIPTAGWIEFTGIKVTNEYEKITFCTHEFNVKWKTLTEVKDDSIARPLLMGYDLEAYSSVTSSMPKAFREEDKIFQISCVFARQGGNSHENYLITLGKVDQRVGKDVKLIMCDTEAELLISFTLLIQEKQPNICIGYNIFTFDIPYMIDRAKMRFVIEEFDMQGFLKGSHAKEKTIKWSSSAYKNQSFQFLDAEGRIFVDLLPLVRRDYRMNDYKLKTISAYFLKDMTKDPLDHKGIFRCYRLGMKEDEEGIEALSLCGKYCVKDSTLVVKLFEVLTTWIALCQMSKVTGVPIFALYTQGQQIKVFSQVYRKATHENFVVQKDAYIAKETDHYVGATVFDPTAGVYDNVVPFDFSSLYPSVIIAYNLCWSTLVDDNAIPDELCNVMQWSDHLSCILKGTLITVGEYSIPIEQLVNKSNKILTFDEKQFVYEFQTDFFDQGIKECIELTFEDDTTLGCTPDHKILLEDGSWKEAQKIVLKKDNIIGLTGNKKVIHIKPIGPKQVYDIGVNRTHNFVANGIVVHNCEHDPNIIKKNKIIDEIKKNELKLKDLRSQRDSRENKYRKEEFKEKINQLIEETRPLREQRALLQKKKGKHVICCERKYRWLKKPMGVLPEILQNLLESRAQTKKELKKVKEEIKSVTKIKDDEKDEKQLIIYDEKIKDLETLADVLDQRQTSLKVSCNSLPGGEAIPCKLNGVFCYRTIEELSNGEWIDDGDGNQYSAPIDNLEVWSDIGLTKVNYVFRHVPNTKIKRIITHTGIVDCTEHHSLLDENGKEVKPSDVKIGDRLMHKEVPLPEDTPKEPNQYETIGLLQTLEAKGLQEFEAKGILLQGKDFAEGKDKRILDKILSGKLYVRQIFFLGYKGTNKKFGRFMEKGSIRTSSVVFLLKSLGYKIVVTNLRDDLFEISIVDQVGDLTNTTSIFDSPSQNEKYVYDLETESHHFAAGIGNLIVHNSGYGLTGATKGYLTCMPIAMCTTYMGRLSIEKAAKTIRDRYKGVLIYGDSVLPDTPILCKDKNGIVCYKTIDNLATDWKTHHLTKQISDTTEPLFVWSDKGFTRINKVIRHGCRKDIYRVTTTRGIVFTTEDHSLLDINGKEIKPTDVFPGDKLLIAEFPKDNLHFSFNQTGILLENQTGIRETNQTGILLENPNLDIMGKLDEIENLEKKEEEKAIYFKITIKGKLNTAIFVFLASKRGYHPVAKQDSDILLDSFHVTLYKDISIKNNVLDVCLYKTNYSGYVYDLETENHHFSAGIGNIVVHNTDSNYVSFPHMDTSITCWDYAIEVAKMVSALFPKPMSIAFEEKLYKRFLILTKKRYMSLACNREGKFKYDKNGQPEISKKGVLLTRRDNCNFVRKVYSDVVMGIFEKKPLEDIKYGVIQELNKLCMGFYKFSDFIITKSVGEVGELVPTEHMDEEKKKIVYKIGDYKLRNILPTNPVERKKEMAKKDCCTEQEYYLHCLPAQAQLAEKMRNRGQLVSAGSRIEYVITDPENHTAKQYEKIEDAEYYEKHRNSIQLDYLYYLKQLSNPIDQVIDAIFQNEPGHKKDFVHSQYVFRYKVRNKVINQIKTLFKPKLKFIE